MRSGSTEGARRRFGLLGALVLSVLLHLVIALLSTWFPFTRSAAVVAVPAAEETITFRFADEAEPTTDDPRADSPFFPRAAQPDPVPPPSPELPEIPPLDAAREESEPVTEREVRSEERDPLDAALPDEPAGSELSERPEGEFRPAPTTAPPTTRRVDLQEALRDFERAIARRPAASQPSQPAGAVQPHVIVPDLARIPFSGFGVGNLVFESRDYDWSDYGRQIYMAIWRAWHNRLWLTTDDFEKWAHRNRNWRLNHRSQLRFVIERNGQVTGIELEVGSECEPLDASALDALAEVILPPLPAGFPRDREVVHARFLAQGPIHQMRSQLGALKTAGYF